MIHKILSLLRFLTGRGPEADAIRFYTDYKGSKEKPMPFHCTVTDSTGKILYKLINIELKSQSVMISGFNENGKLTIPASKLNTVYFEFYHDPHSRQPGHVDIKFGDENYNFHLVTCESGTGHRAQRFSTSFG